RCSSRKKGAGNVISRWVTCGGQKMGALKPRAMRTFLSALALALSGHLPVLAVSGPPLRTGLWMMQPIEGGDNADAFEAQVRANPRLSGVCLHIGWKDIEKEPGKLDFSAIDKYVAVLRHIGMKYELG